MSYKTRKRGLVSVVVTNYNNARYIRACLDSLRDQTYSDIELIVIDDCSTDGSRQVIRDWKNQNRHQLKHSMKLVCLPRNIGFASAVTLGMSLAKGEFIAMQDGDDLSVRTRIEKQVAHLRRHPHTDLIGTNYVAFDSQHPEKRVHPTWLAFQPHKVREIYAKGGHCISHGTLLFRGELFDEVGGPTRAVRGAEDYEFIAKCINAGHRANNLKSVLYQYRAHPNQRSRQFYSRKSKKAHT